MPPDSFYELIIQCFAVLRLHCIVEVGLVTFQYTFQCKLRRFFSLKVKIRLWFNEVVSFIFSADKVKEQMIMSKTSSTGTFNFLKFHVHDDCYTCMKLEVELWLLN